MKTPDTSVYNSQASAWRAVASATGGGVGTAPAEKGHVVVEGDSLGAPDNGHPALGDGGADSVGPDLDQLGLGVLIVGDKAGLAPGEGVCGHAEVVQRHAQQGHGLSFARGNEHVHLPTGPRVGHLGREAQQLVGLLAHGAHHDNDLGAPAPGAGHVIGDVADPVSIGNRGSAELLHDQRRASHGCRGYQRLRRCPPG